MRLCKRSNVQTDSLRGDERRRDGQDDGIRRHRAERGLDAFRGAECRRDRLSRGRCWVRQEETGPSSEYGNHRCKSDRRIFHRSYTSISKRDAIGNAASLELLVPVACGRLVGPHNGSVCDMRSHSSERGRKLNLRLAFSFDAPRSRVGTVSGPNVARASCSVI